MHDSSKPAIIDMLARGIESTTLSVLGVTSV